MRYSEPIARRLTSFAVCMPSASMRWDGGHRVQRGRGNEKLELAAIVDLVQPNLIRITGMVPYQGSRAVELTSDGRQFGLLIPEGGKKVFLTGPIDAPPQSENARENLRPRPFIEVLRWDEGTLRTATGADPLNASDTRTLTVDIASTESTPSRKVDVVFDLAKGVVNTLTAYDNSGTPIFEARYGDWRTATDPSSEVAVGCFARHIVLVELQQDYQVDLRITDLTLNPEIPKSYFHPSPPHGIPIKHFKYCWRCKQSIASACIVNFSPVCRFTGANMRKLFFIVSNRDSLRSLQGQTWLSFVSFAWEPLACVGIHRACYESSLDRSCVAGEGFLCAYFCASRAAEDGESVPTHSSRNLKRTAARLRAGTVMLRMGQRTRWESRPAKLLSRCTVRKPPRRRLPRPRFSTNTQRIPRLHRCISAYSGAERVGHDCVEQSPKPGVSNYFIGNDPTKWRTRRPPILGQLRLQAPIRGSTWFFTAIHNSWSMTSRLRPGNGIRRNSQLQMARGPPHSTATAI